MLAVLHFGGQTLLSSASRQQFVTQVQSHVRFPDSAPLVVLSPLEGMTAQFHTLARLVREGKTDAATALREQITHVHRTLAYEMLQGSYLPATHLPLLEEALRHVEEDIRLLECLPYGSVSVPIQMTRLVTWGARLAAILGALALEKAGLAAWPLPGPAIVTAHPDQEQMRDGLRLAPALLAPTHRHAHRLISPVLARQQIPVVAGEGAITEWGSMTLLAPGEGELTAAVLAVVFRAHSLTLYTTGPALLNADPALIAEAAPIPTLSAEEALCLLAPARKAALHHLLLLLTPQQIPIFMRLLAEPDIPATRIRLVEPSSACAALVLQPDVTLVTLKGRACLDLAEQLPALLQRIAQAGVTPIMVQLFSSQRLSVLIEARETGVVREILSQAGEAGDITCQTELAVCWCIGTTFGHDPLALSRALFHLHHAQIPVVHQSVTDLGLGIVVAANQGAKAIQVLSQRDMRPCVQQSTQTQEVIR